MAHDEARESLPLTFDLQVGEPDEAGVDDRLGAADPERAQERAAGRAGSASMGSRGARPSARSRAAATNAANRGCGRSGRLLNSGCAWVATKNGCSERSSSTNSTSRSSGDVPEHTTPASSSGRRYLLLSSYRWRCRSYTTSWP